MKIKYSSPNIGAQVGAGIGFLAPESILAPNLGKKFRNFNEKPAMKKANDKFISSVILMIFRVNERSVR